MVESIKPAQPSYDANETRLIDTLKTHANLVMTGRPTEIQIEGAAKALIDATTLMLRVGTPNLFELMWDYHVQQHDQACSAARALRGFTRFSEARSYPAALVYNAYRATIDKISWSSYNIALSKLVNGPKLIAFLESKQAEQAKA